MRSLWACLGIVVLSVSLRTYCVAPWVVITNDSNKGNYTVKVWSAGMPTSGIETFDVARGDKNSKNLSEKQLPATVKVIDQDLETATFTILKPGFQYKFQDHQVIKIVYKGSGKYGKKGRVLKYDWIPPEWS